MKEAKAKYSAKDLMGALKLYEDVLNEVSLGRAANIRHIDMKQPDTVTTLHKQ